MKMRLSFCMGKKREREGKGERVSNKLHSSGYCVYIDTDTVIIYTNEKFWRQFGPKFSIPWLVARSYFCIFLGDSLHHLE